MANETLKNNNIYSDNSCGNLSLFTSGILKSVDTRVRSSSIGNYIFGSVFNIETKKLAPVLIDLEKDYSLNSVQLIIDETISVEPTSNGLRLRPPSYQSELIQELLIKEEKVSESLNKISTDGQSSGNQNSIEQIVMTVANQCHKLGIDAAVAILFPKK
tara:strand:+ start:27 stop:503 length:477 start_codon:yes stop_codon:yes gene_type:complete